MSNELGIEIFYPLYPLYPFYPLSSLPIPNAQLPIDNYSLLTEKHETI